MGPWTRSQGRIRVPAPLSAEVWLTAQPCTLGDRGLFIFRSTRQRSSNHTDPGANLRSGLPGTSFASRGEFLYRFSSDAHEAEREKHVPPQRAEGSHRGKR